MRKNSDILKAEDPKPKKKNVRPYYNLSKLTPKHMRMVHMRLQGLKLKDIAEKVGMKLQSVEFFFCSPIVKKKMNEIVAREIDDSQDILQHGAAVALEHLVNRLMDPDDTCSARVKDEIAKDILNRAGFTAAKKFEITDKTPRQAQPVIILDQELQKIEPQKRKALVAALEQIGKSENGNGNKEEEIIEVNPNE